MRANKLRRYYQWRTSRHVEVPYEGLLADKARLLQQIAAMQVGHRLRKLLLHGCMVQELCWGKQALLHGCACLATVLLYRVQVHGAPAPAALGVLVGCAADSWHRIRTVLVDDQLCSCPHGCWRPCSAPNTDATQLTI
jgi:hypothetical protein